MQNGYCTSFENWGFERDLEVRVLSPPQGFPHNKYRTESVDGSLLKSRLPCNNMLQFFRKKKKQPENLKQVLAVLKNLEKSLEKTSLDLEKLKKESKFHLQKIGIIRYNPFSGVGGNQSFSIALLDANDDGFVITSLYNKEESRFYGKPIKKGESLYKLSAEEKEAIKQAQAQNQNERKKSPAGEKKSNNKATGGSGFRSH